MFSIRFAPREASPPAEHRIAATVRFLEHQPAAPCDVAGNAAQLAFRHRMLGRICGERIELLRKFAPEAPLLWRIIFWRSALIEMNDIH